MKNIDLEKIDSNEIKDLEKELIGLIEEEFEEYIRWCEYDEGIDPDEFANSAKESIENEFGKDKFDDFNILSYAKSHADNKIENILVLGFNCLLLIVETYKF